MSLAECSRVIDVHLVSAKKNAHVCRVAMFDIIATECSR